MKNKDIMTICPDCEKKSQIGILWTDSPSKLEAFLGINRYKCEKCNSIFVQKTSPVYKN
jgi:transposase-like protein